MTNLALLIIIFFSPIAVAQSESQQPSATELQGISDVDLVQLDEDTYGFSILDPRKADPRKVAEISYGPDPSCDVVGGEVSVCKKGNWCRVNLNRTVETLGLLTETQSDVLFFVLSSGGTGAVNTGLHAVLLSTCEIASLGFSTSMSITDPYSSDTYRSDHKDPQMQAIQASLEQLKPSFGFVDEATIGALTTDWYYAYYFWRLDNHALDTSPGIVKRRFYESGYPDLASDTGETDVHLGRFIFRDQFKAGVIGFDTEKKEAFVVWAPSSQYDATNLRLSVEGNTLKIEVPDEKRLIEIDTETWTLTHK